MANCQVENKIGVGMKKLLFLIGLSFFCIGKLIALESVSFEVLNQFPIGDGIGEFQYVSGATGGYSPVPSGLAYKDGLLYIGDTPNQRIVFVDENGEMTILDELINPGDRIIAVKRFLFLFGYDRMYQVFDLTSQKKLNEGQFTVVFGQTGYYKNTIIAGDMILVNPPPERGTETPRYFGFHITENFDGTISMMNPEETIRFLKEDYDGTEEFTVDEDGYIFWNGRLVAPYGDSFSLYHWNTRSPAEIWQKRADQGSFIGWDTDNNSYWNYSNSIVILTSNGELVAEMLAENVAETARSQFTVTQEGTLYVLSYNRDRDEFELMKLERFW